MGTRVRVVITHVHVPLYVVNLNLSIASKKSKKYTVTKILQELIVNFTSLIQQKSQRERHKKKHREGICLVKTVRGTYKIVGKYLLV